MNTNSFYKKIALVCLVSVTANQAVHAFQIPEVLGWFKGNPKKSVALAAGFAAVVGVMSYIFQKPKRVIYVSDATLPKNTVSDAMYIVTPDMQNVSFADKKRLNECLDELTGTTGVIASDMDHRVSHRVVTLLKGKNLNEVVGCLTYSEPKPSSDKESPFAVIDFIAAGKPVAGLPWVTAQRNRMKALLLEPVLETRKNIVLCNGFEHDFIKDQITTFDGIEPVYEDGIFKRDKARAQLSGQKVIAQDHFKAAGITTEEWQADIKNLEADRKRALEKLFQTKELDRDRLLQAETEARIEKSRAALEMLKEKREEDARELEKLHEEGRLAAERVRSQRTKHQALSKKLEGALSSGVIPSPLAQVAS